MFFFSFLFQLTPTSATTNKNLEYPNNQSKSFISEDEFYNQLDKDIYKEYKNAVYSVRKKISFKDVPKAEFTFNRKTNNSCGDRMNLQYSDIHPDRQVYFMASFYQSEREEFHKFIVIDAETKNKLLGGDSYHKYENPYK